MTIKLNLTVAEIKAVLQTSKNQLFNVKYLDPRFPGYIGHPDELAAGESAVRVLEAALEEDRLRTPTAWETPSRHGPVQREK